ncbi:MAG: glycosyltransferase [Acidimicrobiia bacterium]|nr:glycosyltransferase [Acidimicrobiia bacterium]
MSQAIHTLALVPPGPGGVRDHARLLAEELANEDPGELAILDDSSIVRRGLRALWWSLRRPRSGDAVVVHYSVFAWAWKGIPTPAVLLVLVLRARNVRTCLFVHEAFIDASRDPRTWVWSVCQRLAFRCVLDGAHGIVVTSPQRAAEVRGLARRPRPVCVAPAFSNVPTAVDASGDEGGQHNSNDSAVPTLAVPSWTDPGAANAVDALSKVRTRLRILLVGAPDPAGQPATAMWRRLEDRHFIEFTGVCDPQDYGRSLRDSTLVLLINADGPSGRKGTLAAALAQGAAVVAIDGPATWTALVERGALAVAPPDTLASTVEHLLSDPAARRELADNARATYEEHFAVHHTVSAVRHALHGAGGIDHRPELTYVAHQVWPAGGMETVSMEVLPRLAKHYRLTVISRRVAPSVAAAADRVVRLPLPGRPVSVLFPLFWIVGSINARHARGVVHTEGAIVGTRADVISVHYSHHGAWRRHHSLAPGATGVAKLNTGIVHALALAAERWCFRPGRVSTIVAVSGGLADEVRSVHPTVRVDKIQNAVDAQRFAPNEEARAAIRSDLGLGHDDVAVAFMGGNWEHKNLRLVLAGAAAADRHLSQRVVAVVAGEGNRARLRGCILDQTHFLGRRSDPERVLAGCDVFCLPSAYETFSLASWEAAAVGLPVVGTRVHGITELIGDDEAGILVEPTLASVSSAVERLARDPTLRQHLGAEARRRASARTWDDVADDYRKVYESVAVSRSEATAP